MERYRLHYLATEGGVKVALELVEACEYDDLNWCKWKDVENLQDELTRYREALGKAVEWMENKCDHKIEYSGVCGRCKLIKELKQLQKDGHHDI